MRRYKPDIIIVLTLLVGIGILATAAAQAAEPGDAGAADHITLTGHSSAGKDGCRFLCRLFGGSGNAAGAVAASPPMGAAGSGGYAGYRTLGVDNRWGRGYDSGIHYNLRMVQYRGDGSIDFNVRLANHRTVTTLLDPYISLSFSGHW